MDGIHLKSNIHDTYILMYDFIDVFSCTRALWRSQVIHRGTEVGGVPPGIWGKAFSIHSIQTRSAEGQEYLLDAG